MDSHVILTKYSIPNVLYKPVARFFAAKYLWIALASGAAALLPAKTDASDTKKNSTDERVTPLVRAVQTVMPAVVNIGTERIVAVSDPFASFFNEFFGGPVQYYREAIPLGSGVIIDDSGLLITNFHVVRRATNLQIRLYDGRTCSAVRVAVDRINDLALLRLTGENAKGPFHPIAFAVPDDLLLGETVAAVGNPFGLEHSVSAGVLSARNRSLEEEGVVFHDILQTDAAINPGNSGGPLVNIRGELIGINIAIRRGADGIGFALPLKRIEHVLARWLRPSRFSLGCCGFIPGTQVRNGRMLAAVDDVEADGPASKAGLKKGDIIVRLNGRKVGRAFDVGRILWRLKPGDRIVVDRADGTQVSWKVCILSPNQLLQRRLGVRAQELTPILKRALGLPEAMRGLAISDIDPDSDLASFGIHRGDIIFAIGNVDTPTLDAAFRALKDVTPGDQIPVFLISFRQHPQGIFAKRMAVNVTVQ